uniref:Uncharacterized protein n=1 Tax=Myotis myotis TaxID=51298 RepID=A0A7J7Y0D0_MYOMY|nr:hypothetical protein mMyoMyo1_011335 [Myotis myotis]
MSPVLTSPHICTFYPHPQFQGTWATLTHGILPPTSRLEGNLPASEGRLKNFIGLMRYLGTMQFPERIFISWMKKYISVVYSSILDALRSLFSNFSKHIFPFFWEEGHTEYDLIILIIHFHIY